jgi:sensor domain CHASE-containing protein
MLLSMGFAIVAIVLSLHVVARGYLLDSFSTLSADLARENTHRAVSAIEGDVADLDADLRDNSAWDDAVTFVETRNEQFIHANLVPSAFRDMRIDLWACLANDGSIVWSGMYDREQGRIEPLSKEWTNVLRPGQALTFHHNQ